MIFSTLHNWRTLPCLVKREHYYSISYLIHFLDNQFFTILSKHRPMPRVGLDDNALWALLKIFDITFIDMIFCLLLWISTLFPESYPFVSRTHTGTHFKLGVSPSLAAFISIYLSFCKNDVPLVNATTSLRLGSYRILYVWNHKARPLFHAALSEFKYIFPRKIEYFLILISCTLYIHSQFILIILE